MIRSAVTTLVELAGLVCFVIGLWWIFPPVGMVALGLGLMFFGWLAGREETVEVPMPFDSPPEGVEE